MSFVKGFGYVLCGVLVMGLFCGKMRAQGAYRTAAFTEYEDYKQEVNLSVGPAIPLGNTRSVTSPGNGFSTVVPRGARLGGSLNVSYRFYPLRQLYIGARIFGHWYGYDYKQMDLGTADRIEHSGWDSYGAAFELGTRLPLGVYGLYFTANFQLGYALMCSPEVNAIYSSREVGDIVRPILARSYAHNFYLGGGVGVQYRFYKRWVCQIGLEYNYMPSGKLGVDNPVRDLASDTDLSLKLSSFVVGVGVSYAF